MELSRLTHLAAPHLIKAKGNVINVSSVASTRPGIGSIPYSVSKACVDMITQCCAVELGQQGVRVNAIKFVYIYLYSNYLSFLLSPALIETPIFEHAGSDPAQFEMIKQFARTCYPVKRTGHVDDTTAGILFLASDQASFYTGVNLPVDGGYLTMTPMSLNQVVQSAKK